MKRALALVTILGVWAAAAAADGGGPSPGPSFGPPGVVDHARSIRYVTLLAGNNTTLLEAISTRGGNVVHWTGLQGMLGLPQVAWDGSMGGLTRDGTHLVLASPAGITSSTRFALLDAGSLKVFARARLRGQWAFDALSPDGRVMYLIQSLGRFGYRSQPYAVRAFNWDTGKIYPGAIVDRREPDEKMNGQPMTRAGSPDGWAYTLYQRLGKRPFVHALDTVHRKAFCIDLPWRRSGGWITEVRMRVRGGSLELRRDGRTITRMDRKTLKVSG